MKDDSERACRWCKSPKRGDPCWYFLDSPEHAAGGGDPPCYEDENDRWDRDEAWQRRHRSRRRRWAWTLFFAGLIIVCALAGWLGPKAPFH